MDVNGYRIERYMHLDAHTSSACRLRIGIVMHGMVLLFSRQVLTSACLIKEKFLRIFCPPPVYLFETERLITRDDVTTAY